MPKRILVVDDERGIAETLTTILRMKGYEAHTAFDGVEGYEAAIRVKPSLVISDIAMPKLNGVEMAIRITEKLPDIKILLMSGQAVTIELLQQAMARGFVFECLAKPVHPIDLLNKVEALLTQPARARVTRMTPIAPKA
jgi:DNA-binding NtrC family response regulator